MEQTSGMSAQKLVSIMYLLKCVYVLMFCCTNIGNVFMPTWLRNYTGPVCVRHFHRPLLHLHHIQLVPSKLVCTTVAAVCKTVVHVV